MTKKSPISTYILIATAGFLVSIFCVYYYIHTIQGNVGEVVGQQVFYLIRVMNDKHLPVANGKVILYVSQYTREQMIDNAGLAVFSDINPEELRHKIRLDISSDGYTRQVFDRYITSPGTIQVILTETKRIHISGKVTDADEVPIPDVVIMVDGTRFFGKSITDGSYSIDITDYSIGDVIDLVSSHRACKDKTKSLTIDRQNMNNTDFVLQRIQH